MLKILLLFFTISSYFLYIEPAYATNNKEVKKELIEIIKQYADDSKLLNINRKTSISQESKRIRTKKESKLPQTLSSTEKDLIIAIDLHEYDKNQLDTLNKELGRLKRLNKVITYFQSENFNTIYVTVANSDTELKLTKSNLNQLKSITVSPNRKMKISYSPNDPYYPQQSYLSSINYSNALDLGINGSNTIIAIMDNGVDVNNSDLINNFWLNNDIYGNLNDDDNNGYIDDTYGCNFHMQWIEGYNYISCDKEYISDNNFNEGIHGTPIAQIAAGSSNNNYGISGVCPSCKIMVLDVVDDYDGSASVLSVLYALDYAVQEGADVINFSMASVCPFDSSEDVLASAIENTVNSNINFVQAAGNNGDMTQTECTSSCGANSYCNTNARNDAYYYVDGKTVTNKINVASIDSSNNRSYFSNYDSASSVISIAAPGESIVDDVGSFHIGTSFSAPIVSGAIGLFTSRYGSSPSYTRAMLQLSGNPINDSSISGRKLNLFKLLNPYSLLYEGVAYYVDIPPNTSDRFPVYRFSRKDGRGHFFTASEVEKNNTLSNYSNILSYDGVAYYVYLPPYTEGKTPVYRFSRKDGYGHFYTASEEEKSNTLNNFSTVLTYEGIAYYVSIPPNQGDKEAVYRFARRDQYGHFYTASEEEKSAVLDNY